MPKERIDCMEETDMASFGLISQGSYDDYSILFIYKSVSVITRAQLIKYHLEAIKQSSEFEDRQIEKLSKYLDDKTIKSTNFFPYAKPSISYEQWNKFCAEAGVERNPNDWLEKILIENGCEIIPYEEFNTDEWV